MSRRLASLALASFTGAAAHAVAECTGDETCTKQLEDDSLMQVRSLGVNPGPMRGKGSFADNSRPFVTHGKSVLAAEEGQILINEDGVENAYYLPGATTLDGGKTVKYTPPYRFYLMRSPTTDYSNADNFYMPEFIGKTFSVDIDFKRNGPACGCNLNFYLVDMPWPTAGQDHDHYCDAQCFPGLGCCAEFDMNEGNMDVQQVTNHACTRDYGGHPDWQCHKWGDPEVKTHSGDFGPGAEHTIDSGKLFTFAQRFDVSDDGDFTFTTTMSQEGRQVVQRMGPGSKQLNAMREEIEKGMVFVTGYWFARDMNWMDGELCGSGPEHCNMNPAYLSNWRLTTNDGAPAPAPSPPAPSPPGPAPPAGAGKCCWGPEGSGCQPDSGNWCSQSSQNCQACSGTWWTR